MRTTCIWSIPGEHRGKSWQLVFLLSDCPLQKHRTQQNQWKNACIVAIYSYVFIQKFIFLCYVFLYCFVEIYVPFLKELYLRYSTAEPEMLIHAFISSHSLSMSVSYHLQAIQNTAVRLLTRSYRHSHITPHSHLFTGSLLQLRSNWKF